MGRTGSYIQQPDGYRAFIPAPLPFEPPPQIHTDLQILLSKADRAIGRLDAVTGLLPNPDLFVAMYVRREALYSSQIEGVTQASLDELLEFEIREPREGIDEVFNYIRAMNHGLERLDSLPLSLRLIREIHETLLARGRGSDRHPGHFRGTQNWIGPPGCTLNEAIFVPPPPQELIELLGRLENFLYSEQLPPLVACALVHYQFETIHPFLDGNGRVGRLLITFQLCWQRILRQPLLYLSDYFKRNRDDYYSLLQNARDKGDIESWLAFFLAGVSQVATDATETSRKILELRDQHRALVSERLSTAAGHALLDALYVDPVMSVNRVADAIGKSYPTANALVREFEELGILTEITGQSRNRLYSYEPYRALFR